MKYQNLLYFIFLFASFYNANNNQINKETKRRLKKYSNTTYCEDITNPTEYDDCFGLQVESGMETCCFLKSKNTSSKIESRSCISITTEEFNNIKSAITNMTKKAKTLKIVTLECDHSFNINYYSFLSLIIIILLL